MITSFIDTCRDAVRGPRAVADVRAAIEDLVSEPTRLAREYPAPLGCTVVSGHSDYLFEDGTLTICMVHTPPGVEQPPHDHLMTAVIGGYAGVELHRLFRRTPDGPAPIEMSTTTGLAPGDVLTIGTAGVHAIDAAPGAWSSAVHVYLGELGSVARSVFHPDTFEEHELTMERYNGWCRPAASTV